MEISETEALDNVLDVFIANCNTSVDYSITLSSLMDKYSIKFNKKPTNGFFRLCLDKFCDDGFTKKSGDSDTYRLTMNGVMFIKRGKYAGKAIRDAQNEKRKGRNEMLLIRGTWAAGIAGFLLFLVTLYQACSRH